MARYAISSAAGKKRAGAAFEKNVIKSLKAAASVSPGFYTTRSRPSSLFAIPRHLLFVRVFALRRTLCEIFDQAASSEMLL